VAEGLNYLHSLQVVHGDIKEVRNCSAEDLIANLKACSGECPH
jgi:serine/threonine protein kinase